MRAILQFDLPDDQNEYEIAVQAPKVQSFLWDFSQQLKKYHHDFKSGDDALDKIREEFYRLINEYNINIDL